MENFWKKIVGIMIVVCSFPTVSAYDVFPIMFGNGPQGIALYAINETNYYFNGSANYTSLSDYIIVDNGAATINFNESLMNQTIDSRDDAGNGTGKTGAGYLYNDTQYMYLNTTMLNNTIDARDSDTTYTNGSGISLIGTQFNHSDTSSQSSSDNSGRTYIQDIILDVFGHITGIVTATETVTDTTNTTEDVQTACGAMATNGNGVDLIYDGEYQKLTPNFDCSDVTDAANDHLSCDENENLIVADDWYNSATDVIGGFASCTGIQYLGADGACHNAGGGSGAGLWMTSGSWMHPNTTAGGQNNINVTQINASDWSNASIEESQISNLGITVSMDSERTAGLAAQDECSEITGCVVGAITDGNTGWDNSYGFVTTSDDSVSSSELDGVCSTNDRILRRVTGTWNCFDDSVYYDNTDTQLSQEEVQDFAGPMATNGNGVNLAYNDGANTLTPSLGTMTSNWDAGAYNISSDGFHLDDNQYAEYGTGNDAVFFWNGTCQILKVGSHEHAWC